ncbi:hypothetical protein, partial [Allobacillus halotolerans]|uniref:hypothetical protein n=1 Tax=Allobacillus halotolerans TaxID=570278 RepID=UPI00288AD200
ERNRIDFRLFCLVFKVRNVLCVSSLQNSDFINVTRIQVCVNTFFEFVLATYLAVFATLINIAWSIYGSQ